METIKSTDLEVDGMTCSSCIKSIKRALSDLEGIYDVDVRMGEGIVSIAHETTAIPVAQLVYRLEMAGYSSRPKAS